MFKVAGDFFLLLSEEDAETCVPLSVLHQRSTGICALDSKVAITAMTACLMPGAISNAAHYGGSSEIDCRY